MNPTMEIIQEVQLPSRVVVRQVKEVYDNGVVGYRIVKSLDFKSLSVGALFNQLRSDRLFAQATNIKGAVQRI
jgi:hypothetical protein